MWSREQKEVWEYHLIQKNNNNNKKDQLQELYIAVGGCSLPHKCAVLRFGESYQASLRRKSPVLKFKKKENTFPEFDDFRWPTKVAFIPDFLGHLDNFSVTAR